MATLKVAFLSSLILELLATISVALVAVAVGLRLLGGHLSLATALFVLILAPEAYLPLRLLGTNYHASAEGMKAAEEVFEVLERADSRPRQLPGRARPVAILSGSLGSRSPTRGRALPALSRRLTLSVDPGGGGGDRRAQRLREVHAARRLLGLAPPWCGPRSPSDGVIWPTSTRTPGGPRWPGCPSDPTSSPGRSPTTSAWAAPMPPTTTCGPPWRGRPRPGRGPACPRELETRPGPRRGRAVGRRAPAGGAGPGLRAGCTSAPARRAHRQSRRADRGERAGAVRRLMGGRTVVIVAHRPSLLALADRVVHLAPVVAVS
jgi:ATP-binding cassette subfamily C protein CydD